MTCKRSILLLFLWVFTLAISGVPSQVFASNLTQTSIRLSRSQAAANPGPILVTFQTSDALTENGIKVTVGQAWVTSAVAGNYTVSTTNLPSGTTPLPGVSTATSVAGKEITFPAADVNSGVKYGFYITGGVPSNPSVGTGPSYVWQVATLVGGVIASSQGVGVSVVGNDQIAISATVGPTVSDFTAQLSTTAPTTLSPGSIVEYSITYGSTYGESSPVTLQAEWSLGTLQGGTTPTVSILSYVDGSASQAYGLTPPVIDTINRTITWSILSLPAQTQNQVVTFQLQVATIDTNGVQATIPVTSRINAPVTTPDSGITHQYQTQTTTPTPTTTQTPTPSATPTPLPTSGATATPTSITPAVPTPTLQPSVIPSPAPATFLHVSVVQIGPTSATIETILSQPGQVTLSFGTQPQQLNNSIVSSANTRSHQIVITSLAPATIYYYQAKVLDAAGQNHLSDLYQFTTATKALSFNPTQLNLALTSSGILIDKPTDSLQQAPIILPFSTPFEIIVQVPPEAEIKRLSVRVLHPEETESLSKSTHGVEDISTLVNKWWQVKAASLRAGDQVLGAATVSGELTSTFVLRSNIELLESHTNVFVGTGISSAEPGLQLLEFQVEDYEGNVQIVRQLLIQSTPPLMVRSSETDKPIEHVRLLLSRFDPETQLYSTLPAPSFLPANPLYSQSNGSFLVVLPPGKYRGEFMVYGYEQRRVDFEIGGESQSVYPTVTLSSAGWNAVDMLQYYADSVSTNLGGFSQPISKVVTSQHIFNLLAFFSLSCLVVVSFFSLASRLGVSLRQLPRIIWHKFHAVHQPQQYWKVKSQIRGETNLPIVQAVVVVIGLNQRISTQGSPNKQGVFQVSLNQPSGILLVTAQGYVPYEQQLSEELPNGGVGGIIFLEKSTPTPEKLWHDFKGLSTFTLQGLFEICLLFSFIMELLFIPHFGIWAVLPFLLLTCLNGAMWIIHVYHQRISLLS